MGNGIPLRRVAGLLQAGHYQEASELLDQVQTASAQQGAEIPAHVLDIARSLCLTCSQYQADAQWHLQAGAEASHREQELRRQLQILLDLLLEPGALETQQRQPGWPGLRAPGKGPAEVRDRPGILERLSDLLSRLPRAPAAGRPGPSVPRAEVVLPSPEPSRLEREEVRPAALIIYCLGPFRVCRDNQLIAEWKGLKCQAVLKYLVARRERPVAKDVLMDVFWPDADPEAARRNLHQAVYSLRKTLKRDPSQVQLVGFENDCYLLNPDVEIWLDFEEFEAHVQAGRQLEAAGQVTAAMAQYGIAESLYAGDFLEEDLYEDWPRLQREQLRSLYLGTAGRLSDYYVERGEYAAATTLCQKTLSLDRCYEEAHRRLMKCYAAQGQRHLAVRQYQACAEALKQELDLRPSEESEALYRQIMTIA